MKELLAVSKWLKKEGNSAAKLAAGLDYKTSQSIQNWIKRKRIPNHMKARVNEFIKSSKKR